MRHCSKVEALQGWQCSAWSCSTHSMQDNQGEAEGKGDSGARSQAELTHR